MPDAALSENLAEMSAAAAAVRAGEVGLAAVDIDTGAGTVHEGDWFAAIGDTIVDIGGQPAPLALRLVELLVGEVVDTELITVVLGDGAPSPENDLIFQALRDAWPDLRIDVIVGGQPHPRYLIGVE
jgi:dihydroxyacetone kinase-like predicted kinase